MGIIRILLAISVVIAHTSKVYGLSLVGGQIAVQTFYIISGFYMTLILNQKYIGKNNSYKLFITNRLLRLYPIYWIVLCLTILVSLILFIFSSGSSIGKLQPYYENVVSMDLGSVFFLVFSNITMLFQDVVMFMGLDTTSGSLYFTSNFRQSEPQLWTFLLVPQAWTIGIEIIFYLIAPFIVRKKLGFVFSLVVLSAFLRVLLYSYGLQHDPWTYRFFPTELMFFLLGTLAYHAYRKIDPLNIKKIYLKVIYGFMVVFTLLYSTIPFQNKMSMYFLAFCMSLPFIFILSKNWSNDRYVGELSYPIYISHMLIILIIENLKISTLENFGPIIILLSILFSILLNNIISKRIEIIRQRRVKINVIGVSPKTEQTFRPSVRQSIK